MRTVPRRRRSDRAPSADTPERRLLLLLAAGAPVRARETTLIKGLAARSDPATLLGLMARQGVLGVLGPRLLELAPGQVDADLARRIERHRAQARWRGELQEMALERVLSSLRERRVPVATLKGPRFAVAVHGDAGARSSGDLDVLVPARRLDDAQAALAGLGWRDRGDPRDAEGLPLLHATSVHDGDLPTVELHWRVHWYERTFAQAALDRSSSTGRDRLEPADELLALLLYIARDGLAGLRLVVDTITWLERGGDAPLAALPALLDAHPALRPAAEAALRLVVAVEGRGRPAPDAGTARERAADALADPLLTMPAKQGLAERGLVDILLSPAAGAGVRRQLGLGRGVLGVWAGHRPPTRLEVAGHTARSLRRYALAGLRRCSAPTRISREA